MFLGPNPRGPRCTHVKEDGLPCRANPMRDEDFCFWHHPDHKQDAAKARRLGGLRRRREKTIEGAFNLPENLDSIEGLRRFVEIAAFDLLGMETSTTRCYAIARVGEVLLKLHDKGQFEQGFADIRAAMGARSPDLASPFDIDPAEVDGPKDASLN